MTLFLTALLLTQICTAASAVAGQVCPAGCFAGVLIVQTGRWPNARGCVRSIDDERGHLVQSVRRHSAGYRPVPVDFPPWQVVYAYHARWFADGAPGTALTSGELCCASRVCTCPRVRGPICTAWSAGGTSGDSLQ